MNELTEKGYYPTANLRILQVEGECRQLQQLWVSVIVENDDIWRNVETVYGDNPND